MTTLQNLLSAFPDYAKDIKLNFSSLINQESVLSDQQFWGTLIACSMTAKNKALFDAIHTDALQKLSKEALSAAKSAAALMAMTNVYYRFTHLVANTEYTNMPAQLRMTVMANPGIEKQDFELFSLAVSAINGCGKCMDAHEKTLVSHGVSKDIIQAAVRIASIVSAAALVLETENIQ